MSAQHAKALYDAIGIQITEFEKRFDIPKATFKNEYGEKFTIYCDGITIMFGGDETDQQVIPLFNEKFNIWSEEELKKLAKAILEILK